MGLLDGVTGAVKQGGACMDRCVQKIVGIITGVLCLGFILCISGPICILIGVILMASPDTRSQMISQYNTAITTWKNQYTADMESIVVRLVPNPPSQNNLLIKINSQDTINDLPKDGEQIVAYTPTYFAGSAVQVGSDGPYNAFSVVDISVQYSLNNGTTWQNAGVLNSQPQFVRHLVTVSSSESDPVKAEEEKEAKCQNLNGFYAGGECSTYLKPSSLNIKISGGASGGYLIDDSFGGYGFKPNSDSTYNTDASIGPWSPFTWTKLTPGVSGPPTGTYTFSMSAQLRHTMDPWVQLQKMTGGSLSFGLSQREKMTGGVILIVVGIALFLPWLVIPIVAIILCVILVKVIMTILNKSKTSVKNPPAPVQMASAYPHPGQGQFQGQQQQPGQWHQAPQEQQQWGQQPPLQQQQQWGQQPPPQQQQQWGQQPPLQQQQQWGQQPPPQQQQWGQQPPLQQGW